MRAIFLCALCSLLFLSCDPQKYRISYKTTWYVVNNSDQPITLSFSEKYVHDVYMRDGATIQPNDTIEVCVSLINDFRGGPSMGHLFHLYERWEDRDDKDKYLNILNNEGDIIKTWRALDKDNSGKQFFKDDSWEKINMPMTENSREHDYDYEWYFEITSRNFL